MVFTKAFEKAKILSSFDGGEYAVVRRIYKGRGNYITKGATVWKDGSCTVDSNVTTEDLGAEDWEVELHMEVGNGFR